MSKRVSDARLLQIKRVCADMHTQISVSNRGDGLHLIPYPDSWWVMLGEVLNEVDEHRASLKQITAIVDRRLAIEAVYAAGGGVKTRREQQVTTDLRRWRKGQR